MVHLRSTIQQPPHKNSAAAVRQCLLDDRVMKGSRGRRALTTHTGIIASVPASAPSTRHQSRHKACRQQTCLTASDQKRRILEVVRRFEHQYVASLEFVPEKRLAIAHLRPAHRRDNAVPHTICIDAWGNISVSTATENAVPVPRSGHRMMALFMFAAFALAGLLIIL